jgi:hypothetical protein
MMSTDVHRRATVLAALQQQSVGLHAPESGTWSLPLSNGLILEGKANVDDIWLTLSLSLPEGFSHLDRAAVWKLLGHNATAGPGVKFALEMHASRPHLRGEMAIGLDDNELLRSRISALYEALRQAAEHACGSIILEPAQRITESALGAERLLKLCDEANWSATLSASGDALAVKLESDRFPCQARVEYCNGLILVATEWATLDVSLTDEIQRAVGIFLLTVSGAIRLASAALVTTAERTAIRAQVVLPFDAGAAELGHALSALSVASRNCGPEISLLLQSDHELTRAFLRGRSPEETASV